MSFHLALFMGKSSEPVFLNIYGAVVSIPFHGIDSGSLCSLSIRYNNPILTPFIASIDCSKIPEQVAGAYVCLHEFPFYYAFSFSSCVDQYRRLNVIRYILAPFSILAII